VEDWLMCVLIYEVGFDVGIFEEMVLLWEDWDVLYFVLLWLVVWDDDVIFGWVVLVLVLWWECYCGVMENFVYVVLEVCGWGVG